MIKANNYKNQINKKTILLVEDEAILALNTSKALNNLGYNTLIANNYSDTLELIKSPKEPIDLILMDIDLGNNQYGTDLAEEILKIKKIPIIFLTSHNEKEFVEKAKNITAYGYLLKGSGDNILQYHIEMALKLYTLEIIEKNVRIKFETIFNSSSDAIFITNEHIFLDCNPQTLRLFKCNREDILNKTPVDFSPPFQPDGTPSSIAAKRYMEAALNGQPQFFEWAHKRLDGTIFITEVSLNMFKIGKQKFLQATVRDITDRKRTERELAAEKEKIAITLSSIGDGVISTDIQGNITLMNRAAEEITGWDVNESQGKNIQNILNVLDEVTQKPFFESINNYLSDGLPHSLPRQSKFINKQHKEIFIADSIAPIKDTRQQTIGYVIVFSDITEKINYENEIFKNQKLESLGILAGGLAHDFNNLLQGIFGYMDLAKLSAKENPEVIDYLNEAILTINRARDITNQLQTFSKGNKPVKSEINIKQLLINIVNFSVGHYSGVKAEFKLIDNLWNIFADENQISQAINNIIINAKDAMPYGGVINITAKNVNPEDPLPPSLKSGNYIKISFTDEGEGISQINLVKIFDPFFSTKEKGHGLGLAVAYSIIKKHEGEIIATSILNKGTTFTIFIPAVPNLVIKKTPENEEAIKGYTAKILIMDDEDYIRNLSENMLKFLGCQTHAVSNGFDAVKEYSQALENGEPYDLVVLDLTVPGGMGGKETLMLLKELNPEVKAIVASGHSIDPIISNPEEYGFVGSLPKPYVLNDLDSALKKLLKPK